ncbi:MAG TPA: YbaB/EbfC family nucleoid-associated protein [Planctomycetaceae bacterium]|nr:YbaB/EbfC family nucleoid-associated protein [Planctomycetaceae bacterium]
MFGALGNLASLLKNAPEVMRQMRDMQGRAEELKQQLSRVRVEGSAGGGMVRVEANGHLKIVNVNVEDSLLSAADREMVEELLLAATNQALEKAREALAEEMSKLAGGLPLSGVSDLLSRFSDEAGRAPDDEPDGDSPKRPVVV